LGAKVFLPNVLGGSAEITRYRIGLVVDYSSLTPPEKIPFTSDKFILGYRTPSNAISKFNYWAIGPNFYFNRKGRSSGGYFGIRYQQVSMTTTLKTDAKYTDKLTQNGVSMLLGTSTGKFIWFGFEIGAGTFLGEPKGFYVEGFDEVKKRLTTNDIWGTSKIIPVANLRLGISF
jgi:hypothetical protein